MSGESAVKPARAPRPLRDADLVYCYDGSFAGFLCCVFASFARHELPFAIWPPEREQATLYPAVEIPTEEDKARRVFRAYCRLAGASGRRLLTRAFLSGEADRELRLLRFLHLVFAEGGRALLLLGHADVAPVYAMDKAVVRETEHLMGFIRFEEAGGMLGAVIHPKNQVLPLLKGHFCGRYPEERFLIYDAAHGTALLYHPHEAQLLRLDAPLALPPPDEREQYYQALWKQFYRTLSIEARRNEKQRRTMCSKRFWADMVELREEAGAPVRDKRDVLG